mmetsp:Transcript_3169/g.8417  ORF Transcript_3169/g.8417 Transcript_3169/m.8417 type:complete len:226 (+) Transcript_3169:710-1387(+)
MNSFFGLRLPITDYCSKCINYTCTQMTTWANTVAHLPFASVSFQRRLRTKRSAAEMKMYLTQERKMAKMDARTLRSSVPPETAASAMKTATTRRVTSPGRVSSSHSESISRSSLSSTSFANATVARALRRCSKCECRCRGECESRKILSRPLRRRRPDRVAPAPRRPRAPRPSARHSNPPTLSQAVAVMAVAVDLARSLSQRQTPPSERCCRGSVRTRRRPRRLR